MQDAIIAIPLDKQALKAYNTAPAAAMRTPIRPAGDRKSDVVMGGTGTAASGAASAATPAPTEFSVHAGSTNADARINKIEESMAAMMKMMQEMALAKKA